MCQEHKPIGNPSHFEGTEQEKSIVDIVPGRGSGFSVEAPEGVRFLIRSRLFEDNEWAILEKEPVLTGQNH